MEIFSTLGHRWRLRLHTSPHFAGVFGCDMLLILVRAKIQTTYHTTSERFEVNTSIRFVQVECTRNHVNGSGSSNSASERGIAVLFRAPATTHSGSPRR